MGKPGNKKKQKDKSNKKQERIEKLALYAVEEKVLCYEPDSSKAKVLYDAKVLKVVQVELKRGKLAREYLIHFQGWNSSWDRFVAEDLVLKDNETNRALQLELAEKAEAMFQATNTKSSKKRSGSARTIAEIVKNSLRGISSDDGGDVAEEVEVPMEEECTDESEDEEPISLSIPNAVKEALDLDYFLVNKYDKLTELPAEPNAVQILEGYVKHFGFKQLVAFNLKNRQQPVEPVKDPNNPKRTPASAPVRKKRVKGTPHPLKNLYERLRILKEVAEGCRILLDFMLHKILLYKVEKVQFEKCADKLPNSIPSIIKESDFNFDVEPEVKAADVEIESPPPKKKKVGRPPLKPKEPPPCSSRSIKPTSCVVPKPDPFITRLIDNYKQRLSDWTLVPPALYQQLPSIPSLIYGVNHLLRLIVKLPDILRRQNIPRKKLKVVVLHVEMLFEFIMEKHYFGPHLYVPKESAMKRTGRRRKSTQPKPQTRSEQLRGGGICKTASQLPDFKIKISKP